MLSSGEMVLSPAGDRMNSLSMGDSVDEVGELLALLEPASDPSTEPFLAPFFCARRSVDLVSLRKTRSNLLL